MWMHEKKNITLNIDLQPTHENESTRPSLYSEPTASSRFSGARQEGHSRRLQIETTALGSTLSLAGGSSDLFRRRIAQME